MSTAGAAIVLGSVVGSRWHLSHAGQLLPSSEPGQKQQEQGSLCKQHLRSYSCRVPYVNSRSIDPYVCHLAVVEAGAHVPVPGVADLQKTVSGGRTRKQEKHQEEPQEEQQQHKQRQEQQHKEHARCCASSRPSRAR